jgi:hypothetical protein
MAHDCVQWPDISMSHAEPMRFAAGELGFASVLHII